MVNVAQCISLLNHYVAYLKLIQRCVNYRKEGRKIESKRSKEKKERKERKAGKKEGGRVGERKRESQDAKCKRWSPAWSYRAGHCWESAMKTSLQIVFIVINSCNCIKLHAQHSVEGECIGRWLWPPCKS